MALLGGEGEARDGGFALRLHQIAGPVPAAAPRARLVPRPDAAHGRGLRPPLARQRIHRRSFTRPRGAAPRQLCPLFFFCFLLFLAHQPLIASMEQIIVPSIGTFSLKCSFFFRSRCWPSRNRGCRSSASSPPARIRRWRSKRWPNKKKWNCSRSPWVRYPPPPPCPLVVLEQTGTCFFHFFSLSSVLALNQSWKLNYRLLFCIFKDFYTLKTSFFLLHRFDEPTLTLSMDR